MLFIVFELSYLVLLFNLICLDW